MNQNSLFITKTTISPQELFEKLNIFNTCVVFGDPIPLAKLITDPSCSRYYKQDIVLVNQGIRMSIFKRHQGIFNSSKQTVLVDETKHPLRAYAQKIMLNIPDKRSHVHKRMENQVRSLEYFLYYRGTIHTYPARKHYTRLNEIYNLEQFSWYKTWEEIRKLPKSELNVKLDGKYATTLRNVLYFEDVSWEDNITKYLIEVYTNSNEHSKGIVCSDLVPQKIEELGRVVYEN